MFEGFINHKAVSTGASAAARAYEKRVLRLLQGFSKVASKTAWNVPLKRLLIDTGDHLMKGLSLWQVASVRTPHIFSLNVRKAQAVVIHWR